MKDYYDFLKFLFKNIGGFMSETSFYAYFKFNPKEMLSKK